MEASPGMLGFGFQQGSSFCGEKSTFLFEQSEYGSRGPPPHMQSREVVYYEPPDNLGLHIYLQVSDNDTELAASAWRQA